jgi:hypothetical protein
MSRRQTERGSRFEIDIEEQVRIAAATFRDNDVEASMDVAVRLWWTSRLRGRRFAQLLGQARDVTQQRISLGVVERGKPGRREAMPYFLAVLRDLVGQESTRSKEPSARRPRNMGARGGAPFPPDPLTPVPAGTRISEIS